MKRVVCYCLFCLTISFSLLAQRPDPDYMDQVKRHARVNSHVEKVMSGKVVSYLFKGSSLALDAFVFKSDRGKHYLVNIRRNEGEALMPHIPKNAPIELTVTGDPVLLERVIYPSKDIVTVENKLKITLNGLVNFKKVSGEKGEYVKNSNLSLFRAPSPPEVFEEAVAIKKRKRYPGNRWAYILENDDTILVSANNDDKMKGRKQVSYYKSRAVFTRGNYFRSPNTYNMAQLPFNNHLTDFPLSTFTAAKIAVVLDRGEFDVIGSQNDERGLFNGLKVLDKQKEALMQFHPRNGEKVQSHTSGKTKITAFYSEAGDDVILLHALKDDSGICFLNNRRQYIKDQSNYKPQEVTFNGKITKAKFTDTSKLARLRHMIISDSVYVYVKEIVAINIQKLIKEGKEITVTGHVRKSLEGEINQEGYTIMAVNSFTIDRKTFKQQTEIKSSLQ